MRVLVVDDEVRLAENIAAGLREGSGYAVDIVHDGEQARAFTGAGVYDLIVLDLMLPNKTGDELLIGLRTARDRTPVLVLTAIGDTHRKIELLNSGADDYLAKPFDLGELIARCRALIRRGKGIGESVLAFGPIELFPAEQKVLCSGRPVDLSPTEYRILEYLIHRPRVVVSKKELLEHLYDFTWKHHSNVVEAHVSNLRKKLRHSDHGVYVLETLRGRGYRLAG